MTTGLSNSPQGRSLNDLVSILISPWVARIGLLAVCSVYIVGGFWKALNFHDAVAEMQHFGLNPGPAFALATLCLELIAPVLILTGRYRWLAAGALGVFTFFANLLANRFWELSGTERFVTMNGFFEHIGLVGAFILIAWQDLRSRQS